MHDLESMHTYVLNSCPQTYLGRFSLIYRKLKPSCIYIYIHIEREREREYIVDGICLFSPQQVTRSDREQVQIVFPLLADKGSQGFGSHLLSFGCACINISVGFSIPERIDIIWSLWHLPFLPSAGHTKWSRVSANCFHIISRQRFAGLRLAPSFFWVCMHQHQCRVFNPRENGHNIELMASAFFALSRSREVIASKCTLC
jgi:hypothetical protein